MVSAAEQLAQNINFSAFSKAEDLQRRIWFTLGALVVYRFGTFIPIPGVNPQAFAETFERSSQGIATTDQSLSKFFNCIFAGHHITLVVCYV